MSLAVDTIAGVHEALAEAEPMLRGYTCCGALLWPLLSLLRLAYSYCIVRPLAVLYLHGPILRGFGMWGGAAPADICAQLTGVRSDHWLRHEDECLAHIRQHFDAIVVTLWFALCLFVGFKLVAWAWDTLVAAPVAARRELRLTRARAEIVCACVRQAVLQTRASDSEDTRALSPPVGGKRRAASRRPACGSGGGSLWCGDNDRFLDTVPAPGSKTHAAAESAIVTAALATAMGVPGALPPARA